MTHQQANYLYTSDTILRPIFLGKFKSPIHTSFIMAPKGKYKASNDNPLLPHIIDLYHQPLVDQEYKILETSCEFDLYELHNWLK